MKQLALTVLILVMLLIVSAFAKYEQDKNTKWLPVLMPLKHMATETVQIGLRADGVVVWK